MYDVNGFFKNLSVSRLVEKSPESGNRVCALKYGHHQYAMQRAQGTYTGVKNGNGHYLRDEMAVLND